MDYILMFLMTFVVFFVIDLIWLGVIAKKLYDKYLGYILAAKVNWAAALIFYGLFIIGLVYFAVNPAVNDASALTAIISGGLFGFFCYATYDLTNLATLKGWPLKITVIDLLWGTFIGASSATLGYLLFTLI